MAKEKITTKIDPSSFEFIQQDKKIYDKKFETKPIGYFKDAMIRFGKNRTNVIATFILVFLIMLAIFVPMLTSKNFTQLETQVSHLPPRMPLIEKLGIFDGTLKVVDQTVDRSTIDPLTGIGLPIGFNPDYIKEGTLENYNVPCTDPNEACFGGQTLIRMSGAGVATYTSPNYFSFTEANNPQITVDITDFNGDSSTKLEIFIEDFSSNEYLVQTIVEEGSYTFNPLTEANLTGFLSSRLYLVFTTNDTNATYAIQSVSYSNNTQSEPVLNHTGFFLYQQYNVSGQGSKFRQNGELLKTDFRYDKYGEVFAIRNVAFFDPAELYALIEAYPDQSKMPSDLNNLKGFVFPADFAVKEVVDRSEIEIIRDREYYSYNIILDYAIYAGYDGVPYFLFGTTGAGYDLFALSWLGLRTSLMLGLIASAINIFFGIIYGAISGYYGGKVDLLMERFSEIIARIPFLVTLSIFVTLIGPGALTLILILIISGWIGVASVTRTQFYRYKGREYVLASRTLGAKDSRLIFRHILPNGIGTIITASILSIPFVIFTEAALSYLGYGLGHGQSFKLFGILELSGVSIGVLLSDGRTEMLDKPYLTLFPALIISILMITFNMFGNALRDAFNPSLRGSE